MVESLTERKEELKSELAEMSEQLSNNKKELKWVILKLLEFFSALWPEMVSTNVLARKIFGRHEWKSLVNCPSKVKPLSVFKGIVLLYTGLQRGQTKPLEHNSS